MPMNPRVIKFNLMIRLMIHLLFLGAILWLIIRFFFLFLILKIFFWNLL